MIFGENVHIFFGEPLQSPCMLLGLMTGLHDGISVNDIGLNNKTEADGLAVGRASKFVGKIMEPVLSGCYTVDDSFLFRSLKGMYEQENIFMEPSAHAGVFGPIQLISEGKQYLEENGLTSKMENATHLIWSTGGDMVPFEERKIYLEKNVYECPKVLRTLPGVGAINFSASTLLIDLYFFDCLFNFFTRHFFFAFF